VLALPPLMVDSVVLSLTQLESISDQVGLRLLMVSSVSLMEEFTQALFNILVRVFKPKCGGKSKETLMISNSNTYY
jgi:hypothetical protein